MSEATQALCFLAGANSIFTGDKLLTTGNAGGDDADAALFAKLGLRRDDERGADAGGGGMRRGAIAMRCDACSWRRPPRGAVQLRSQAWAERAIYLRSAGNGDASPAVLDMLDGRVPTFGDGEAVDADIARGAVQPDRMTGDRDSIDGPTSARPRMA